MTVVTKGHLILCGVFFFMAYAEILGVADDQYKADISLFNIKK